MEHMQRDGRGEAGAAADLRGAGLAGETHNSRAYAALKEAVLAGTFKPGEVLTLRGLATRLAIGDTPVREALKRLTSEGAFEALPNRSARIPVRDRREIQQILELRIMLESNAAALAAQNITLHQIEHLRALHKQMGAAVAVDDSQTYGELNMAFHFEIYRIAENRTLATLIEALWLRMAPFVSRKRSLITSDPPQAWHVACAQHEALLLALQTRDAEAARAAMRADLSALTKIDGYWEGVEDHSTR
ncbi:MAG TPA: GntR family transcriptional regulator [Steroidobacteraceae bacterium]|nr:GntR family transcriptional regulator [Steroidobacteraceae bacterium]